MTRRGGTGTAISARETHMVEIPPIVPRRNWLLHALQATIAASLAAIFYPVARFLRPRATTNSGAMEVVAPYRVNELTAGCRGQLAVRRSTSAASRAC